MLRCQEKKKRQMYMRAIFGIGANNQMFAWAKIDHA